MLISEEKTWETIRTALDGRKVLLRRLKLVATRTEGLPFGCSNSNVWQLSWESMREMEADAENDELTSVLSKAGCVQKTKVCTFRAKFGRE